MMNKFDRVVMSIVAIGLGIIAVEVDRSYAENRSLRSPDFVSFKYANEFKLAHPKSWIVEPSSRKSNCHIYKTDSTMCTFAYIYSFKPNFTSKPNLKNYIKTDVLINFSPIGKASKSRAKKIQVGGLPAYRLQGVIEESDLGRMNYLSTIIAYKNNSIELNTYFHDLKDSRVVNSVHDSFQILR